MIERNFLIRPDVEIIDPRRMNHGHLSILREVLKDWEFSAEFDPSDPENDAKRVERFTKVGSSWSKFDVSFDPEPTISYLTIKTDGDEGMMEVELRTGIPTVGVFELIHSLPPVKLINPQALEINRLAGTLSFQQVAGDSSQSFLVGNDGAVVVPVSSQF